MYECVSMYVCESDCVCVMCVLCVLHVCMYACVYVCVRVCGRVRVCPYALMYVCMEVFVYVCIYMSYIYYGVVSHMSISDLKYGSMYMRAYVHLGACLCVSMMLVMFY